MADVDKRSSVIDEEEKRADSGRIRPLGAAAALAVLILVLVLPALYRPTLYGKLPFDAHIARDIETVQPQYVFIGNSMLGTRIDAATLARRLGKNCCYVLWTGGAESAWDHQALKNEVLAARHRPKVVFVFFRDAYLTRVNYRADDAYWWKIERLSHDREPELMRAMRESRTWQERLEYTLGLVYPIQKRRDEADYALEWLASQAVAPARTPFGAPVAARYNELFGLDRLKSTDAADDAGAATDLSIYDFEARLPKSLLPAMIEEAKEAGTRLVFIRVQRRPTPSGPPPQPPELVRYMARLEAYLAASGAGFYDFTGDPELTLDRYLDGDHIEPSWKAASTELFLRRLDGYFR
ncbi:MAG TPA: hypothetical protein VHZ53_10995 [Steroidobacteraceae bacterium]|jgi:hypothetical protein|nr:hypothetical protein [Steroidobacteraceae bacterium]